MTGAVQVIIRGGTYYLNEPFALKPQDSGMENAPVLYSAHPGERPIFSGGVGLTNWSKAGRLWQTKVPAELLARPFRQLFIGGSRATLARSPNSGYFRIAELVPGPMDERSKRAVARDRFKFAPNDLAGITNSSQLEVILMHSWENSIHPVRAIERSSNVVQFTAPLKEWWSIGYWEAKQRYFVQNALELVDAPGEWFLDYKTGLLSYFPRPEDKFDGFAAIAPRINELVVIKGDPQNGQWVEHVELRGLTFHHADWNLSPEGNSSTQAAVEVPAAVMADGARNCRMTRCEVAHVGTYATWFRQGCKSNILSQNRCFNLGAGGIRVGEDRMAARDELESSHNLVDNNLIFDGGHVYPAGIGIWLAQSSYNRISHNDVHGMRYSGLSIGWNWDDSKNRTHHNVIEWNHVHHLTAGELSDEGLIYCLGASPGSVIRNNIFHDISPYSTPPFGWGIYLDATCSGYLVESNLVYNTRSGGIFWNNGGHEHIIRNNIFAYGQEHQVWPYWEKRPNTFERNIVLYRTGNLLVPHSEGTLRERQKASEALGSWDYNLYWREDDPGHIRFFQKTFSEWTNSTRLDLHSAIANPKFPAPQQANFQLPPDSPALSLGFHPFTNEGAGLYGEADWKNQVQHANCR